MVGFKSLVPPFQLQGACEIFNYFRATCPWLSLYVDSLVNAPHAEQFQLKKVVRSLHTKGFR